MNGRRAPTSSIGVDTGGTFTDLFASDGTVLKVPSTPRDPVDAIRSGLGRLEMGAHTAVAHGTTVATNTVLERSGARTALLTTAGFEDVLEIRRQNRPAIYDLAARWPPPLVPADLRLGVSGRLDFEGAALVRLEDAALARLTAEVEALAPQSIAVCLLFSYVNPAHELAVAAALRRRLGVAFPLSLSHQIAPRQGEFERTSTTVVNAYVMPRMRDYLRSLEREVLAGGACELHVMHSNGGLLRAGVLAERPVQTVLSGPAAGVVGARAVAAGSGREQIITFDMGGTSTDVSVVPGEILEGSEGEIASFPLLVPMLTIETVGAGGGSIAWVDAGGGLHVGPRSAGADPGPAAYGRGEEPTVTDANLILGRLGTHGLLGGGLPLDEERARAALECIAGPLAMSSVQAAWAVVRLANSNMEAAVRTVSLQRGHDPRRFTLVAFGGAGPLHAAELAAGLGMEEVLVPPHPGVLAALGLTVPPLQRDYVRTVLLPWDERLGSQLDAAFVRLEENARAELGEERSFGEPEMLRSVDMRYAGQSFDLRVPFVADPAGLRERFQMLYRERYGITPSGRLEVVNVRLRAALPRLEPPTLTPRWPEEGRPDGRRTVWFGSALGVAGLNQVEARVVWRPSLPPGATVAGPAVLEQYDSTTVVPPGWHARVDESFNLLVRREA